MDYSCGWQKWLRPSEADLSLAEKLFTSGFLWRVFAFSVTIGLVDRRESETVQVGHQQDVDAGCGDSFLGRGFVPNTR